MGAEQDDAAVDTEASDGVGRRRRGVVTRRLLVLAVVGVVLVVAVVCRLST